MTQQDDFLTTTELLDYLQVNLQTVHRLIKTGQIPPVRVGREWLFRRRDIDGWIEASREAGLKLAKMFAKALRIGRG